MKYRKIKSDIELAIEESHSSFGSLEVERLKTNEISIRFTVNHSIFRLWVELEPDSNIPIGGKLNPSLIPHDDVVQFAVESKDLKFLVREIRWRIDNWFQRSKELDSLKEKEFSLEVDKDDPCLIQSKFLTGEKKEGKILFYVPLDYPQVPIEVLNVEKEVFGEKFTNSILVKNKNFLSNLTENLKLIDAFYVRSKSCRFGSTSSKVFKLLRSIFHFIF